MNVHTVGRQANSIAFRLLSPIPVFSLIPSSKKEVAAVCLREHLGVTRRSREAYRRAFDNFGLEKVCGYGEEKPEVLGRFKHRPEQVEILDL